MSTQNTALAAFDPTLAALGLQAGEPLKPTNLILVQKNNADAEAGVIPGRFLDPQSNMQFPSLDVAVIQIQNGQVLYPPGEDNFGAKPLCRSSDGIMPVINDQLIRQDGGRGCKACPKNQWKRIGGKLIRPECAATVKLLAVEIDTEFIYRVNFKRTAVPVLNEFREGLRKVVTLAQKKGAAVMPYGLIYTMSSVKVSKNGLTWYVPKFTAKGMVQDPEQVQRFGDLFKHFVLGNGKSAMAEDPVDAALEGDYQGGSSETVQPEYVDA